MDKKDHRVAKGLHPFVYRLIVLVAVLWVVASWSVFFGSGYAGLTLAVVAVFSIIVVVLSLVLGRIWRSHRDAHPEIPRAGSETFHEWLSKDFEIWQGREKGREAAIEILLPLGVAIVGAIGIGLAFLFSHSGVGH